MHLQRHHSTNILSQVCHRLYSVCSGSGYRGIRQAFQLKYFHGLQIELYNLIWLLNSTIWNLLF